MKTTILSAFFVFTICTGAAHAGFWTSLAGSAVGNTVTNRGCGASPGRMDKANTYLWDMHKAGKYEEGYQFYLQFLEQSEDVAYLDTVSQVYNDNGDKEKAILIYESRILPWIALEDNEKKAKYRSYYEDLKSK